MEIGFGSVVNLLSYLPFSSRRLCFSSLSDIILHLGRSSRLARLLFVIRLPRVRALCASPSALLPANQPLRPPLSAM